MSMPFRVGEHVTGEFFTNRRDEVTRILRAMRDPSRLLVYGERRQGKSSAIRQAADRFEHEGGTVLWVDVSTASKLTEVARRLVTGVPYRWIWREDLQTRLIGASLRIEAGTDIAGNPVLGLAVESRASRMGQGKEELRGIIHVLDGLAAERDLRMALVFDEFQQIAAMTEGGDWVLRDLMQTTHHLSFICAGSGTSVIREMICEEAPFHGFFEALNVRAIDPGHLAGWIEDRMAGAGVRCTGAVGRTTVDVAGPRTQDCLQLARAVYVAGLSRGRVGVDEVAEAMRRSVLEDSDRFETTWNTLVPSQQAVIRAVAAGEEHLYASDTAARHGLPTSGTIGTALKALQKRRLIADTEPFRVEDPFFRQWILLRAMPDGLPHALG